MYQLLSRDMLKSTTRLGDTPISPPSYSNFFIAIFALYSSKLCYKVHIYLELLCLPGKCNPLSLYNKSPNSPNSFCLRVYLMCLYTHIHNIYLHMCTYTHTFIYTVCA